MADVKKTTARKTAAVKTTAKKEAEKVVAAVKKETVKAAEEVKAVAKKAPAKKVPEKKAPAKKAAASIKSELVIQFNGNDYTPERLIQSAKDVWLYDMGKDLADFKSVELYVKPEESKVYAVVNGTETISFVI